MYPREKSKRSIEKTYLLVLQPEKSITNYIYTTGHFYTLIIFNKYFNINLLRKYITSHSLLIAPSSMTRPNTIVAPHTLSS